MSDEPVTLHHYTTAAGLLGILEPVYLSSIWEAEEEFKDLPREQSFSLWATDARYLNDWGELDFAAAALASAIDARLDDVEPERRDSLVTLAAQLRQHDYTADVHWTRGGVHAAYITCFCEEGDLLGQWQGYAANGGGYSLEFHTEELKQMWGPFMSDSREEFAYNQGTILRPINYGLDEGAFAAAAAEIVESSDDYAMFMCVHTLVQFKDDAFSAEREWRAINVVPESQMFCKFRTTLNGRVIPYSRFFRLQTGAPFDPAEARSAIKSVKVGPGLDQKLRAEAVRKLLDQRGFQDTEVTTSKITYNP